MFNQSNMPMPSGPSQSEAPERFEVESKEEAAAAQQKTQWAQNQSQGQTQTSASEAAPRAVQPMQKRRRVTRACDECRRKKIKCDGKQPCTHCTVYSYECTFDQPSNRRRNPAPQYIEALENRLQRAEALLRTFIPNIDLSDPNFEAVLAQRKAAQGHQGPMHQVAESVRSDGSRQEMSDHGREDDEDAQLRSMIETTGQLELDDQGHWDFHGGSSGAVFFKRMREQFDGLLGADNKLQYLPRPNMRPSAFSVLESPRSSGESPLETGLPNVMELPSKAVARDLAGKALNCACALLRFVHHPSFYKMFDRIYDTPPEAFGDAENKFLPLLYVTLALGCMFMDDKSSGNATEGMSYQEGIDQGLKYFKAARGMMDITDCRDMWSLQAILFMILFLQSSANLSTCYSYIGIALRSALRMGLHRNITYSFNPIERETRRRVFWIIRKMDTYVAALLGFPKMLSDQDVDQELPLEVDDDYITETEILPMPPGKLSVFTASNAHTRLMAILAKVIREIYPTKAAQQCVPGNAKPTYVISHAKIKEIEVDLQEWLDKLPMGLRPGGDAAEDIVRVQQLLRMAYAHVQMMLYRPFLHYVSSKHIEGKPVDERSYACAAACVSVSRNIVHITAEMQRRGLLIGAYWFTMYTTFFAILSLAFFVLENPTKPGTEEILANASAGRDALKALARTSMAADRCSTSLVGLFEQLRNKVAESKSQNAPEKNNKRRNMSRPLSSQLGQSNVASASASPATYSSPVIQGLTQRALTFPLHPPTNSVAQRSNIEKGHYTPSSMSDSNLHQTFQNLTNPGMESTGTSTPDTSMNSPAPGSQPQPSSSGQDFYPPFTDVGLTDLSAMMFPSADPFAYPNQPMLSYESRHPNVNPTAKAEFLGTNANTNPTFLSNIPATANNPVNMFRSNMAPSFKPNPQVVRSQSHSNLQSQMQSHNPPNLGYDSLEGQVFGPLPPYMMEQQGMGLGMDLSGVTGLDPLGGSTGFTPGLGAGQGWEDMFGEWTTPGDLQQGGGDMKGF